MDLSDVAMPAVVAIFAGGLVLLFGGGHLLVDGSVRLARTLRINSIIIGLTVVALGTSMPEFLVSLIAALRGEADIALGNIVGSNVSNLGLILGLSALVRPIDVNLRILKFEIPLVIAISIYFWLICLNGDLSRMDGLSLALGFLVYLFFVIKAARKGSRQYDEKFDELPPEHRRVLKDIAFIVAGIVGLSYGASWLVDSASEISVRFGVSQLTLGLTVVALGTSLPELATSLVAALKREGDISIGNIIGSNIFNMMAVAGPTALVSPLSVTDELTSNQIPIMVVLTLILVPIVRSGKRISRGEGALLLAFYAATILWWTL